MGHPHRARASGLGLLHIKRRTLFIVSCILTGAGMFMFATTNYLRASANIKELPQVNQSFEDTSSQQKNVDSIDAEALGWLPLVSIMLVAVGYHIGLNPIIWSYTGKSYIKEVTKKT